MTAKIKRAAGSMSILEMLLERLGVMKRSTGTDITRYEAGMTIKVFCNSSTLGGDSTFTAAVGTFETAHSISRAGCLYVSKDIGIEWRRIRGTDGFTRLAGRLGALLGFVRYRRIIAESGLQASSTITKAVDPPDRVSIPSMATVGDSPRGNLPLGFIAKHLVVGQTVHEIAIKPRDLAFLEYALSRT